MWRAQRVPSDCPLRSPTRLSCPNPIRKAATRQILARRRSGGIGNSCGSGDRPALARLPLPGTPHGLKPPTAAARPATLSAHTDELRELVRSRERPLAHDPDSRSVDLLVVSAGLEPRALERREDVAHLPVRDSHGAARRDHPGGVLRLSGIAL